MSARTSLLLLAAAGASYEVLRHFRYRPEDGARSPLELSVLRHGSHADYIVYRRRSPKVCDAE